MPRRPLLVLAALALAAPLGPAQERPGGPAIERRPLEFGSGNAWGGRGIAYGPHRDGQTPDGGPQPTREQVREDLRLLDGRFDLVRMYGAGEATEFALEAIEEEGLGLRMMLGAWIAPETTDAARAANEAQVAEVVRLANAHPGVVCAVSVGNETQVFWTGHRVEPERLIAHLRRARAGTGVPVTTCDDFNFWNRPESEAFAREVDFIGLHAYAMWNGRTLTDALSWTRAQIDDVARQHPGVPIVHAESGWATRKHTEGEQATLIKGEPGEEQQELFFRAYTSWAEEARQAYFYFEAFDENWKGGDHPDEVEKHWGLWNADRTPKLAVDAGAPEDGEG